MEFSPQLIRKRFSRAAKNYDKYALIQKRIGNELFEYVYNERRDYYSILDIGTGTAKFLRKLSLLYPEAFVFGLDFSHTMLIEAQNNGAKYLIQADANALPFGCGLFDLVTSNLAYQWLIDLDRAFYEVKRVLQDKGKFYFSIFGRRTLKELRKSIGKIKDLSGFVRLPSKDALYNTLKNVGFSDIEIISRIEQEFFPGFFRLLQWLKSVGANQHGIKFYGLEARGLLAQAQKLYQRNFGNNGRIIASFEKILVKAKKK